MIRPVTCVCVLLACGSGLYLYQSKHRVQVLDREIEKTVHATDALREQTRMLHAEWTLMNDPQRLQALSEQFLNLKTVTPGQFTSMADVDNRLPAVRVPDATPAAAPTEPAEVPVAQAPEITPPEELPRPPLVAAAQAGECRCHRRSVARVRPEARTVPAAGGGGSAGTAAGADHAATAGTDHARFHASEAVDGPDGGFGPRHGAYHDGPTAAADAGQHTAMVRQRRRRLGDERRASS
jgi:hypothetical protein